MAKNNNRAALFGDANGDDAELLVTEGGAAESSVPSDTIVVSSASDGSPAAATTASEPGLMLSPVQGMTVAGQLAAYGALRTAYQCVYGQPLDRKKVAEWAEGGVVLPAEKRDAEIIGRICATLGVLTDVVGY